MPQVLVSVISALELKVPQGAPVTPYVEIEYAAAKRTTTTARETEDVTWNESFTFELVEDEDEMTFHVFLPGGIFIGKALLSFSKFGTDADLCFELADANNEVGGKLFIKVEPVEQVPDDNQGPKAAGNKSPTPPVPQAQAQAQPQGPKTRLSISKAEMIDIDQFVCTLTVAGVQKVCDMTGGEEYLFSLLPDDDVIIDIHSGGQPYGSTKLKGSVVLGRSGTNSWIVVSNSKGHHVGKVLLTVSVAIPVEALAGPLGNEGIELKELGIIVVSAEKLPRACDACVVLSIGDNDKASNKKLNTKDPEWGEKFTFFVDDDDTLSAKVFDNEDFVAEAIVPISELLFIAPMGQQLEVKLLDRKRRNAGLLVLGAEVLSPTFRAPSPIPVVPAIPAIPAISAIPAITQEAPVIHSSARLSAFGSTDAPLSFLSGPSAPLSHTRVTEIPFRREEASPAIFYDNKWAQHAPIRTHCFPHIPLSASSVTYSSGPLPLVRDEALPSNYISVDHSYPLLPSTSYVKEFPAASVSSSIPACTEGSAPGRAVRYGGRIRLGEDKPTFPPDTSSQSIPPLPSTSVASASSPWPASQKTTPTLVPAPAPAVPTQLSTTAHTTLS